jgi:hypothetical protein
MGGLEAMNGKSGRKCEIPPPQRNVNIITTIILNGVV